MATNYKKIDESWKLQKKRKLPNEKRQILENKRDI